MSTINRPSSLKPFGGKAVLALGIGLATVTMTAGVAYADPTPPTQPGLPTVQSVAPPLPRGVSGDKVRAPENLPLEMTLISCPASVQNGSSFTITLGGFPAGTVNLAVRGGTVTPTSVHSNGTERFTAAVSAPVETKLFATELVAQESVGGRSYTAECQLKEVPAA